MWLLGDVANPIKTKKEKNFFKFILTHNFLEILYSIFKKTFFKIKILLLLLTFLKQMSKINFSQLWIIIFSLILLLSGIAIIILSLLSLNFEEIIPSKEAKNINNYLFYGGLGLTILLI